MEVNQIRDINDQIIAQSTHPMEHRPGPVANIQSHSSMARIKRNAPVDVAGRKGSQGIPEAASGKAPIIL